MGIFSHLIQQRKKNGVLCVSGCQLNRIDNDQEDEPEGASVREILGWVKGGGNVHIKYVWKQRVLDSVKGRT